MTEEKKNEMSDRDKMLEAMPEEEKPHYLAYEAAREKLKELQEHCKKFVDENKASVFLVVVDETTGLSDMQVSTKDLPAKLLTNRRINNVVSEAHLRTKSILDTFNF